MRVDYLGLVQRAPRAPGQARTTLRRLYTRVRGTERPPQGVAAASDPRCCFWAKESDEAHSGGSSRGRRSSPTATYVSDASVTLTQITSLGLRWANTSTSTVTEV